MQIAILKTFNIIKLLGFALKQFFERFERFKMTVTRVKTIPYVDDTIKNVIEEQ